MGRLRFVFFYLMCGLVAGFAQIAIDPSSPVPNVGASGAIAGVLGGYILLYPHARVTTLIFLGFFITFVQLPAIVVLLFWITLQVLLGFSGLYTTMADSGVAYFAHIGGFAVGILTIRLFTLGHRVTFKQGAAP